MKSLVTTNSMSKPYDHHTYTDSDGKVIKCNRPHIVCAANRYATLIIPSALHHDKVMNVLIKFGGGRSELLKWGEEQGFIDQYGNFWTREEAMEIVKFTGQKIDL